MKTLALAWILFRYHLIEMLLACLVRLRPDRVYARHEVHTARDQIPYIELWAAQYRMPKVLRWKGARKTFRALPHQDIGQHISSISLVAMHVVNTLRRAGVEFDAVLLHHAVAIHDYGEVILGYDVDSTGKNSHHDVEEVCAVLRALHHVSQPHWSELMDAFLLQYVREESYAHFPEEVRTRLQYLKDQPGMLRLSHIFRIIEILDYLNTVVEYRLGDREDDLLRQLLDYYPSEVERLCEPYPELSVLVPETYWDGLRTLLR